MVDLFADIPETTIEHPLQMIKKNLDKIELYGGHTLRLHTDIQVLALKTRLTHEDIKYATSFWNMEVTLAVTQGIIQQFYDDEISYWLKGKYKDTLPMITRFPKTVGYGFKKGEEILR